MSVQWVYSFVFAAYVLLHCVWGSMLHVWTCLMHLRRLAVDAEHSAVNDAWILVCWTPNNFKVTWFISSDWSWIRGWKSCNLCFTAQKRSYTVLEPAGTGDHLSLLGVSCWRLQGTMWIKESSWRRVFKNEGMKSWDGEVTQHYYYYY